MKTLTIDRIFARTALLVLGLALPVMHQSHGASTILASGVWSGNEHTYLVVQFDLSTDHRWDTARAEIDTLFGPDVTLATITSPEEDEFIRQLLGGRGSEWWIGGFQDPITEPDPAAGWTWVTGEPFLYTHWGSGEPNDGGRLAGEQHLALDFGGLWWNDEGSALGAVAGYVTELQVVPEPGTAAVLALGALALSLSNNRVSHGLNRRRWSSV